MAEIKEHAHSALWTEGEAIAVVLGGVAAVKWLDEKTIFKEEFASNPGWFQGDRALAPFKIKYFGAIKALGACFASTYVENPWLKLALIGVAVQGTIEQGRILTWDNATASTNIPMIGSKQAELDARLKALAEAQRQKLGGPEYVGDLGDRYESNVAGTEYVVPQAERYASAVAGPVYDEDAWSPRAFDTTGAA